MNERKLGTQKETGNKLVKSQKSDFGDILDLSSWEKTQLALTSYFTKIMTVNKVPKGINILHTVIFCMQSLFSSLLITDPVQWDIKSQSTRVLRIFSIVWEGATSYGPTASTYTGIVISIFILLSFIFILIRAFNYGNGDRMSIREGSAVYILTKLIFSLLIPIFVCPIPISISEILKENNTVANIICLILCLIADMIVIYGTLEYFSVQINFDDSLTHEWDPNTALQKIIFLNVLSILLGTFSITPYNVRLPISILFALMHSTESCFVFFSMPYTFIKGNVLFSCASATAFVSTIVHIIGYFVEIVFLVKIVIICVIFVIYYLTLNTLFNRQLEQNYKILDELFAQSNNDEFRFFMEEKFSKPNDIIKLIHATFERSHPFLFQWDIFEYGINVFPENGRLLLQYIRIIAIFPSLTEKLIELADRISMTDISNPVMIRAIIASLIKQRSNIFSVQLDSAIRDAEHQEEGLQTATKNFWESLEAGRTEGFWNSVQTVAKARRAAITAYAKIRENFPNSLDGLHAILDFEIDSNYNAKEARDVQGAISRIYKTTRAQLDPAFESGIKSFPFISFPDELLDDSLEAADATNVDDINENVLIRLETLNALTVNPRLGSIKGILIYIIIIGLAVFILSYIFTTLFKSQTIEILQLASEAYMEVNAIMYSLSMYALQVTTMRYIKSGYLDVGHEAMQKVSKYAYKAGHIEAFDITDEDIAETREEIRSNIVGVSNSLLRLENLEAFKYLKNELFVKSYKDMGISMMSHVSDLITQTTGDVDFFREVIDVYNSLQALVEESANGLDITGNATSLETLLISIIVLITVLYMLPLSIKIFMMNTQMDNLRTELVGIAIDEFSKKDSKDDDERRFIHLESRDTHIFWMNVSFVVGVVPVIASLMIGYFIAVGFIATETDITVSSAFVRTSFSTARLGMIATLQQYVANDIDGNADLAKEMQELKTAFVVRSRKESQSSILISMKEFSQWLGMESQYIFNESELEESYTNIPACSLMIDRLVIQNSLMAPDNMIFFLSISDPGSTYSMIWLVGELFWYNSYSTTHRDTPYFDHVLNVINKELQESSYIVQNILYLIAFAEFLVFVASIGVLLMLKIMMNNAVWIMNSLNPVTILKNENLMLMLNEDKVHEYEEMLAFRGAETVIEKLKCTIFLLNRKLQIVDINKEGANIYGTDCIGKPFQDMFDGDAGWKEFMLSLFDVPTGRGELHFTKEAVIFFNDNRSNVRLSVASLCNDHTANTGEAVDIETIMVTVQDISEFARLTLEIEENAKQVKRMLSNMLPDEFVSELEAGTDTFATIVQSITIGEIKVEADQRFDFMTDKPHKLMDSVYKQFDEYIKDYETLNKCWTFAHGYTFAGGVFATINRPGRHAEDALRFSLRLITELPKISEKVGANIKLTIGLHTGGPIVAGVMSVRHPQFLIIGDVQKIAHEMRNTANYGVVHISRQVYELVYSAGFTVEEDQDIEINATTMRTYNILPL